jgi:RND family efflux transporter MFP subunit
MLAESRATLDYARIVAPFAGRVIERRIDPGSLASPGNTLLVVEQEGALRVEAPVDELRGASIAIGDTAIVELEPPRSAVRAVVSEIVPSIDVASRAFIVKVDLPIDVAGLRPGMFSRVAFRVGRRSPLVVPSTAVTSKGALDRVFVIEGDRAHLRIVTLGEPSLPREGSPRIEVLSGLDEGEQVVSTIPIDLRDGAPVTVTSK